MYTPRKFEKKEKPYKFLTLSFDDGVTQDERFIELLDKHNILCTFNINSGLFGNKHFIEGDTWRVDHSEVDREVAERIYVNHEVAAHSLTHPRLDLLSKEDLLHEVGDDVKNLREVSGQNVWGMAYPGGPFFNDFVIETLLENTPIRYARDIQSTYNYDMPDNLMIWHPTCHWRDERVDEMIEKFIALEPTEDCLLYIWGHSYEFDIYNAWERVDELLSSMANKEGITYATNGEIAEYIMNNTEKI